MDFSNTDVLIRIYEVSSDEKVIQDITFATNSQNPVDFRDLKSNSEEQRLLEQGAKELGFVYKRKRDNSPAGLESIPSSVAAEAVLAIWRDMPHLAKHKKHELFSTYYGIIFKPNGITPDGLNPSQMIIAVLIHRYCDNQRRKASDKPEVQAQRKYSQHFLSMLMGKQLLMYLNISFEQLTNRNFGETKRVLDERKESLYEACEAYLTERLRVCLSYLGTSINEMDGRTVAAAFRRPELVGLCLSNLPRLVQ